jgi:NTE family protein
MPTDSKRVTPIDGEKLEDLVGFCLSGGGYRAMLFHAGAIFRLNELGLLAKLDRVSSVSGGSMAAAALAVAYPKFQYDAAGRATNLTATFLKPVLDQAIDPIDVGSAFAGLSPFSSASAQAAESYERNLTKGARLSDVPTKPLFVFNATSLMTGVLMRFRPDYVADYQIGQLKGLNIPLADVVAASAGFPPVLSPMVIDISAAAFVDPAKKGPLGRPPYTETAVLTDGGVYDNMGTETVWKRCRTILLSNAGKPFGFEQDPAHNWLQQSLRVLDIVMDQAEDLRERILVHAYEVGARRGAMWGLTSGLNNPADRPSLLTPAEFTAAQNIPTRLTQFSKADQALLLKAGYAHATSRIRKWYGPANGGPADIPDGAWPTP